MSSTRRAKGRSETPSNCLIKVTKTLTFTHKNNVDITVLSVVAGEVEHGLFMTNDAAALRDGPSSKTKPEDLDESAKRVQHRRGEKRRRDASHETLKRMSFFFKAPPGSLSRNEVLFFGESNYLTSNRLVTYHGDSSHHLSPVWRKSVRRRRVRHRIPQVLNSFNSWLGGFSIRTRFFYFPPRS